MADHDITKMKVADLKKELKLRNLPTTGNKNELTERLQAALLDGDTTLDDAALNADADLLDDDVLNDDELDDDDEKSLLDPSLEEAALKTPPAAAKLETAQSAELTAASQKKVVLKRKLITAGPDDESVNGSTPSVTAVTAANKTDAADAGVTSPKVPKIPITAPQADDDIAAAAAPAAAAAATAEKKEAAIGGDDAKKVVKIGEIEQLSYQERLALRAKRFGAPTPAAKPSAAATRPAKAAVVVAAAVDPETLRKRAERFGLTTADETAKLAARAARFGLIETKTNAASAVSTTTKSPAAPAASVNAELVEQMRKRAERFGGSVSKVMLEIESEEKRLQRLERFNAGKTAAAVETVDSKAEPTAAAAAEESDAAAVSPAAVAVSAKAD